MSTIPQLRLFSLYPGGPQLRANGYLNGNSSFYTQATAFTPAYGVNVPASAAPVQTSYALGSNGAIRRSTPSGSSNALASNDSWALDASAIGGIKRAPVPPVAPVIPNLYRQAAELLSISDLKFAELMQQDAFRIPGVGLGLKVTTDGMGGVDSVRLSPSSRAALPAVSPFHAAFAGPNRSDITTGVTFKASPHTEGMQSTRPPLPGSTPTGGAPQSAAGMAASAASGALSGNGPLDRAASLNNLFAAARLGALDPRTSGLNGLLPQDMNPVLQRLYQMQPPDNGLAVSGYDAALSAEQARQMAATQARMDVMPSRQFRQDVAGLVSAAVRQEGSYAAAMRPPDLDGRMPMAPSLPHAGGGGGQGGLAGGGLDMNNFSPDAFNKRGKGGYIPFQMSSGGQEGFASGGFTNPFAAGGMSTGAQGEQAGQQRPRPRRALQLSA